MTHQGHSLTTFTCGFTQPDGNDSGNRQRGCRQSGMACHTDRYGIRRQSTYAVKHGLDPDRRP